MVCFKCSKDLSEKEAKYGLHKNCFLKWFETEDDFQDLTLHKALTFNAKKPINASFFHGKFEKYSAILRGKQYLLKISREHLELAKTEYLCNQIAVTLGLEIPPFFLINFMGQDCFVSYNFMQDRIGSDLKHIYHFLKEGDAYTLETLIKIIGDKTGRLKDIKKLLILCLFDAFIGNDDRHGRNLALIFDPKGCSFSPCYDNPSFIARMDDWVLGADLNSTGVIETLHIKAPTLSDYVKEVIRLGYKSSVEDFIKSIKLQELERLINDSFLSSKRKRAFINFLHKKIKELNNELLKS